MTLAELARLEGWILETVAGRIEGCMFTNAGWDVPTNVNRLSDYAVSTRTGPVIWFRKRKA